MTLNWVTPGDAAAMAAVHAQAFAPPIAAPWGASAFDELLAQPGVFGALAGDPPQGLVLCRLAAGEMEVLTLGVAGAARRCGLAQALMTAALGAARAAGAEACFLEVAVDNIAAVGLYERLGFVRAGIRRAYYNRGASARADALVMRLDLVTQDA
jgi:ribosomal-protein-alanine N-acetyltransferase